MGTHLVSSKEECNLLRLLSRALPGCYLHPENTEIGFVLLHESDHTMSADNSSNEDHGVEQHNSETGTDGEVRKPLNNGDRRMEEILKMLECVQILTKEVAKNEDVQEKKDEWNTVVAILDRAFRMLFLIMFFLSTLAIFYFSMV